MVRWLWRTMRWRWCLWQRDEGSCDLRVLFSNVLSVKIVILEKLIATIKSEILSRRTNECAICNKVIFLRDWIECNFQNLSGSSAQVIRQSKSVSL